MTRFRTLVCAAGAALVMMTGMARAETALFAGGCFWCVEADMDKVPGVTETVSGYAGGKTKNPTYENHERGGHREVVRIEFDPDVISYRELVATFLRTIDVTDAGGQFYDRGHSYTTAIHALNEAQAKAAREAVAEAEKSLGRKIVTPVEGPVRFWPAEEYHQDYYKSEKRTLSRFGYVTRASAYKRYREGSRRTDSVRELWGDEAYRGVRMK
ncbi:MAG: peptide-methionine (S)-S-oxide reductase [Phyllobacteriaceae bacterium]|nr:peptide-methionine (S)-S-oxide reductase [Phyllobacteriaceae bacterium]MBA90783.1 peptide-methionine (S)-S-oxide reductase [Phyllobacteriaceae bacterium]